MDPALADGGGDRCGEAGIGQQQEAPLGDAVGLVVEAFGEHLREIGHHGFLEQPGVDGGHAVGAVRADDGHVRHADFSGFPFFDQAHAGNPCVVAGIAGAHVIEEAAVDFINDLQLPRQHHLEPPQGPCLERLGQERVIGVGEGAAGEIPCKVPAEAGII